MHMIVNRAFEPVLPHAVKNNERCYTAISIIPLLVGGATLSYTAISPCFFPPMDVPYALRTQRPHTFTSFAAWKAARLLDDVCPEGTNKDRDVLAE